MALGVQVDTTDNAMHVSAMKEKRKKSGREILNSWIREQEAKSKRPRDHGMPGGWRFSITRFATSCGVSRQTLRQWTLGAVKPDHQHRFNLSNATCGAVPMRCWE